MVVAFLSIALVYVLYARIYDAANYLSILLLIVYSFVVSTIVCGCFGFNKDERQKVLTIILGKLKK